MSDYEFIGPQELDEANRKYVIEAFSKGEGSTVVGNVRSCFKDDVKRFCGRCGKEISLRPWMAKLAEEYKQKIICLDCANKEFGRKDIFEVIEQSWDKTVHTALRNKMHKRGIA